MSNSTTSHIINFLKFRESKLLSKDELTSKEYVIRNFVILTSILVIISSFWFFSFQAHLVYISFLIIFNFGEYLVHRFVLHSKKKIFQPVANAHTFHHSLYPPEAFNLEGRKHAKQIILSIWSIAGFMLGIALPTSLIIGLIYGDVLIALAVFSAFITYLMIYDAFHLLIHLPVKNNFLYNLIILPMRNNHIKHHADEKATLGNHGILTPTFDIIFNTTANVKKREHSILENHILKLESLDQKQKSISQKYSDLKMTVKTSNELINLSKNEGDLEVKNSFLAIQRFFKDYDDFNMNKIDTFFEIVLDRANKEIEHIAAFEPKFPRSLSKKYKEFLEHYQKYEETKYLFRSEEDTKRLIHGIRVLPSYGRLVKAIRQYYGENPARSYGPGDLQPFVDTPKQLFKMIDRYAVLLFNVFFRYKDNTPDKAPIIDALGQVQKRIVETRDINTSWQGLENLEDLNHDGETLNIFIMNHANSFLDTSAQQSFPVNGISSIGDVDIFFPQYMVNRMAKCGHMVAIGHGDTDAKTKKMVNQKQLNKFFLAIEGITGVGLYEMRPIMPTFDKAVYTMIEKGINLKLYPVVYPDNFVLLNDFRIPIGGRKNSRGVLQRPITKQECLNIKKLTESSSGLSTFIRWGWFSQLENNSKVTLAMPFSTQLMKDLESMTWGDL